MAWKLSDFIRDLRSRIDEPVADYFLDEELIRWLNEAFMDLALELRLEDILSIPVVSEVTNVDIPDTLVSIRSVYVNGSTIKLINMDERSSSVLNCYLWGKKLYFTQPIQGNVEIFYIKEPNKLVGLDDITDIPSRYQHLPVLYAFSRCKEKDEEQAIAASIMDQYQSLKYEMITELRQKQQFEGVSFVEPYGGSSWKGGSFDY